MTVLSDTDICREIAGGNLAIESFKQECVRSSSYLLRLSDTYLFRDGGSAEVDTKNANTSSLFQTGNLSTAGTILKPFRLHLFSSIERVCLPDNICGELSLLSCYARVGISANFGSNFVAASFGKLSPSRLTFEVINLIGDSVRIYPGVKFCHLRLSYQNSASETKYHGIYQDVYGDVPANFFVKPAR